MSAGTSGYLGGPQERISPKCIGIAKVLMVFCLASGLKTLLKLQSRKSSRQNMMNWYINDQVKFFLNFASKLVLIWLSVKGD